MFEPYGATVRLSAALTTDTPFVYSHAVCDRVSGPMIEVSFRSRRRRIMLTPVCAIFLAFVYLSNPLTFSINPVLDRFRLYPTMPTVNDRPRTITSASLPMCHLLG